MAAADYCLCEVCGKKSFYDAHLEFDQLIIGDQYEMAPVGAGSYAGLCISCTKTHTIVAVERKTPVRVISEFSSDEEYREACKEL